MAKSGSQKSLVIVESYAKSRTINKYLGSGFEVKASIGHVRDLPSKGLNVDIENDFEPTYEIMPGRKRTVTSLRAAAKKCDKLFLATDLDREGEAIAWHLAQILGVPEEKTYRVIFNAITQSAIKRAFAEPGKLNMDKVMAQQTRRILDRIVGYKISPAMEKNCKGTLRRPGPVRCSQDDSRKRKGNPRLQAGRVLAYPRSFHSRLAERLSPGMAGFHHS